MSHATGLCCLRCGRPYELTDYATSCPACEAVVLSGFRVEYDPAMLTPRPPAPSGSGLWRYGDLLPVDAADAVSLGEGNTPLLALPRSGAALGLERLYLKDETRQPTGSFKDRLACVGVSAARAMAKRVIVSSSSGNAGASAAAYAARAGMPCIVFTFRGASAPLVTQMRALGAMVAYAEHSQDRLALVREGVARHGWFPTSPFSLPVSGSNPLALEGYKTLAYEIAEALDWEVPDWCVLPVCYGDALAAIWRGFTDMRALGWIRALPRLVAAEVSGSLSAALASGDDAPPEMHLNAPSIATSIAAARGTYQSLDALRRSGGRAVTVDDASLLRLQAALGREEGLWIEPSSAAALAAVERLVADGSIGRRERVVVLATAGGLKDPARAAAAMPPVPVVPNDLDAAMRMMRDVYGVSAELGS